MKLSNKLTLICILAELTARCVVSIFLLVLSAFTMTYIFQHLEYLGFGLWLLLLGPLTLLVVYLSMLPVNPMIKSGFNMLFNSIKGCQK